MLHKIRIIGMALLLGGVVLPSTSCSVTHEARIGTRSTTTRSTTTKTTNKKKAHPAHPHGGPPGQTKKNKNKH